MTSDQHRATGATVGIVDAMKKIRRLRGMHAEDLAAAMKAEGFAWGRPTVTAIETHRRKSITIDELLALAKILGVAPVHLIVPRDADEFAITPQTTMDADDAREWIAGTKPIDDGDLWSLWRPHRAAAAAARPVAGGTTEVVSRKRTRRGSAPPRE